MLATGELTSGMVGWSCEPGSFVAKLALASPYIHSEDFLLVILKLFPVSTCGGRSGQVRPSLEF